LGVYNGALFIEEQIESIISQNFSDWTLYIRDDASTDNTQEIIKRFAMRYDNIIIIDDLVENLGCNGNYFRLLSLIESEYYMFCNADDFWFPFKIEVSMSKMRDVERIYKGKPIIVHTDLSISDRDLNIMAESYWEETNTDPERFKSYNMLGLCNVVAGATMLFNKKVKELTFPVPKSAPFFDHWIALQVVNVGIISSVHLSTMSYRQIGTNLAAVAIKGQNSFFNKIITFRRVISANLNEANLLRGVGWGSYSKYLQYKIIVLFIIRFGRKYQNHFKNA
jgi:rhamnosyltransferase